MSIEIIADRDKHPCVSCGASKFTYKLFNSDNNSYVMLETFNSHPYNGYKHEISFCMSCLRKICMSFIEMI
jgi:hypothetical protein